VAAPLCLFLIAALVIQPAPSNPLTRVLIAQLPSHGTPPDEERDSCEEHRLGLDRRSQRELASRPAVTDRHMRSPPARPSYSTSIARRSVLSDKLHAPPLRC
jgi:hypothetical protein